MNLVVPEDGVGTTEELLTSLHMSLSRARLKIEDLLGQVTAGEDEKAAEVAKTVASLDAIIRNCQTIETKLVERRYKQSGIARGGYALDLERARAEIGRRLSRLRLATSADVVPE